MPRPVADLLLLPTLTARRCTNHHPHSTTCHCSACLSSHLTWSNRYAHAHALALALCTEMQAQVSDSLCGQPNWTYKILNHRSLSAHALCAHSQASRAVRGTLGQLLLQPPPISHPPRSPACTLTQGPSRPSISPRSATYLLGGESRSLGFQFREAEAFFSRFPIGHVDASHACECAWLLGSIPNLPPPPSTP